MNSAKIEPTAASVAAVFMPAKMYGTENGKRTLKNSLVRRVVVVLTSSVISGWTLVTPAIVLTRIGKNVIRATIVTIEVMPKPSQMMIRGASATLGTE